MTAPVNGSPRRVLMVLFHFPPIGGISMSRNVRNVQYLPDLGWSPVVITPGDIASPVLDPGSAALVSPDVEVIRTKAFTTRDIRPALQAIRRFIALLSRTKRTTSSEVSPPGTWQPTPVDALTRARRLLFFPDNAVGWLPFAVIGAVRRHRRRPVALVYSTFPPMTAHLVAGLFHAITGVPWVAEFRDPWIGNPLEPRQPWLIRQLRQRIERWTIRRASRVVAVTPRLIALLERRYPGLVVGHIPNGYDRSEIRAQDPGRRAGPFRLVYTGTLDRPAELAIFLQGLGLFEASNPDPAGSLQIDVYGVASDATRQILLDRSMTHADGVPVTLHGFVARSEAIDALAQADAALVLLGDGPNMDLFIPGKLMEYIGQDKQVFAMLPAGDARDLLVGLGWGVLAKPSASSVAEGLDRLLREPRPRHRADPEGRYERRVIAGRLAAVLDEAVTDGRLR